MNHNKAPGAKNADGSLSEGVLVDGTPKKLPHEYSWQEREALDHQAAEKFKATINLKFAEVEQRDDHIAKSRLDREHEQRIELDPSAFKHLSADGKVVAVRSIPGEEDAADRKWTYYGGPRILMSEPGRESRQVYFLGRDRNRIDSYGLFGPEPDEDRMIESGPGIDPSSAADLLAQIEAAKPSNLVEAEVTV